MASGHKGKYKIQTKLPLNLNRSKVEYVGKNKRFFFKKFAEMIDRSELKKTALPDQPVNVFKNYSFCVSECLYL